MIFYDILMLYVMIINDLCALCVDVFSVLSVGIVSSLLRASKVYGIDKVMNYII